MVKYRQILYLPVFFLSASAYVVKEFFMGKNILNKVRKLNWVLQEAPKGVFSFNQLCEILSELTDSNIYLTNKHGKLLGYHLLIEEDGISMLEKRNGQDYIPDEYNVNLMEIAETLANFKGEKVIQILPNEVDTKDKWHMIIPVLGGGERWATLLFTRYEPEYSEEDIALAEIGATTIGIEIQRKKNIEAEEDERNEEMVRMAIGTLSYSENEAVKRIFEELDGIEGILVASRVADKSSITRSVIVNALRKLESAGVIESRSLGMKGTHIKVINEKLLEYLKEH